MSHQCPKFFAGKYLLNVCGGAGASVPPSFGVHLALLLHALCFFVVIHSSLTGPQVSYNYCLVLLNFCLVLLDFYDKWLNYTVAESALSCCKRWCNGTLMLS